MFAKALSRLTVVYNRIRKLLLGAPKAVKTYNIEHGEIPGLYPEINKKEELYWTY